MHLLVGRWQDEDKNEDLRGGKVLGIREEISLGGERHFLHKVFSWTSGRAKWELGAGGGGKGKHLDPHSFHEILGCYFES